MTIVGLSFSKIKQTSGSTNPFCSIIMSRAADSAKSPDPTPPALILALLVPILPCLQPKGSSGALMRYTGQNCSTTRPPCASCTRTLCVGVAMSSAGVQSARRIWNSVTSEGGYTIETLKVRLRCFNSAFCGSSPVGLKKQDSRYKDS